MSPELAKSKPSEVLTATAPSWKVSSSPDRTRTANNALAEALAEALARDRGLALFTPITANDFILHRIDHRMKLLALV